jgi:hypothetical protein
MFMVLCFLVLAAHSREIMRQEVHDVGVKNVHVQSDGAAIVASAAIVLFVHLWGVQSPKPTVNE